MRKLWGKVKMGTSPSLSPVIKRTSSHHRILNTLAKELAASLGPSLTYLICGVRPNYTIFLKNTYIYINNVLFKFSPELRWYKKGLRNKHTVLSAKIHYPRPLFSTHCQLHRCRFGEINSEIFFGTLLCHFIQLQKYKTWKGIPLFWKKVLSFKVSVFFFLIRIQHLPRREGT